MEEVQRLAVQRLTRCLSKLVSELIEVLAEVRADAAAISSDPTEVQPSCDDVRCPELPNPAAQFRQVKSCARELLPTWVPTGHARAQIAPGGRTYFAFSGQPASQPTASQPTNQPTNPDQPK